MAIVLDVLVAGVVAGGVAGGVVLAARPRGRAQPGDGSPSGADAHAPGRGASVSQGPASSTAVRSSAVEASRSSAEAGPSRSSAGREHAGSANGSGTHREPVMAGSTTVREEPLAAIGGQAADAPALPAARA